MRKNAGRQLRFVRGAPTAALVAAWLMLAAMPAGAQCIMCRESLASGGSKELITGFIFSTLLLTAVPVALLSTFAFVVYRSVKRQAAIEAALGFEGAGEPAIGPPPKV